METAACDLLRAGDPEVKIAYIRLTVVGLCNCVYTESAFSWWNNLYSHRKDFLLTAVKVLRQADNVTIFQLGICRTVLNL